MDLAHNKAGQHSHFVVGFAIARRCLRSYTVIAQREPGGEND